MSNIYKITNIVNGKLYIGRTRQSIKTRFASHKHRAKYQDTYLYRAFKKYGIENFTISLLCKCSNECEDFMETFYMELYKTLDKKYGYNLCREGGVRKHSKESILKMKKSHSGKKATSEQLRGLETKWKSNIKTVYRVDSKGFIKKYESLIATKQDNFNPKAVSRAINNRTGVHKGFYWTFKLPSKSTPPAPFENAPLSPEEADIEG